VASPQLLARGELDALRRFAWSRGGSVVFLLDVPPSGELGRLLSVDAQTRREAAPVALGALKASEFLVLRPLGPATSELASAAGDPVVVSRPLGHGRVVISGALDAWRYRAEGQGFESFWRSVVGGAAAAAGEPMRLTLTPRVAAPGEHVEVEAEWRPLDPPAAPLEVDATLRCGSMTTPVRLWPAGGRWRFRGGFDAPAPGTCEMTVELRPGAAARAALRVMDAGTGALAPDDVFTVAVGALGGKVVDSGDEAALVAHLAAFASPERTSIPVHPMRSPWWIAPFAAALGLEWWGRRRRGLL
jgi:hypothetical protein